MQAWYTTMEVCMFWEDSNMIGSQNQGHCLLKYFILSRMNGKKKTVIPTDCINLSEEKDKLHMEKITFKGCFVRLPKGVINELEPLNTRQSCSASL